MTDPKGTPPPVADAPADYSVEGVNFAARAAAYFIDLIYIVLLSLLIAVVPGVAVGMLSVIRGRPLPFDQPSPAWFSLVLGLFILTLYFVLLEGLYGATPGKRRLKLCVVQADGEPCGLGAALIRAVLRYVDVFMFGLVAYVFMHPPLYQRLGDQLAHTIVVRADSPFIRRRRAGWWYGAALALFLFLSACFVTPLFMLALR